MRCFLLILLCLFTSQPSFAWDQADKIAEIKVVNGSKTLIRFQDISWHGCNGNTQSSPAWFLISEGDNVSDQRKQMLSIALAALMSDKQIWVVTGSSNGDTPPCSSEFEWVYQISIYP